MSIIADQTLLANLHAIAIPVLPLAVELGPGPATLVAATCTLCWCECVYVHAHLRMCRACKYSSVMGCTYIIWHTLPEWA